MFKGNLKPIMPVLCNYTFFREIHQAIFIGAPTDWLVFCARSPGWYFRTLPLSLVPVITFKREEMDQAMSCTTITLQWTLQPNLFKTFPQHLVCAPHCFKHCTNINLFNPHYNMRTLVGISMKWCWNILCPCAWQGNLSINICWRNDYLWVTQSIGLSCLVPKSKQYTRRLY